MNADRRIAMLIDDGFDDDELERIGALLVAAGTQPALVAPFAGRAHTGRHRRSTVTAELGCGAVRAGMFAAIAIPGGYAPDRLRLRHAMLDLVRDAVAGAIPVAAMGHGAQVLISAGVIHGRTLTCWPSIAIDVKNAGGLYVDRPVVDDRGVITARKAEDAGPFAEALLRAIERSR